MFRKAIATIVAAVIGGILGAVVGLVLTPVVLFCILWVITPSGPEGGGVAMIVRSVDGYGSSLACIRGGPLHGINSGRIRGDVMSWGLTATGVFYAISSTACWILVIVAIFVRRPPDEPNIEDSLPTGSPFQTNA